MKNKNTLKISALALVLVLMTIGYVLWGNYLTEHFVGSFNEDGLPSQLFRTGWDIMLGAWPLWVIPTLFILLLAQTAEFLIRSFLNDKNQKNTESNLQKTQTATAIKDKNQLDFTRALEVEGLKQQVDILKHKYFEEHQKTQEALRNVEEMTIALEVAQKEAAIAQKAATANPAPVPITRMVQPTNAHNEAIISSLKAENKKLKKQVSELQEDLEQSNALIEKLLETQGG